MRRARSTRKENLYLLLFAIFALWAAPPPAASAEEPPPLLWQVPEDRQPGAGAGRLDIPRGIGASPLSGHLYVADRENARIAEFTAWGEFVRAFGWGVEDGTAEMQVCTEQTGCQKGIEGDGAGQLGAPQGVAFDATGNVYVHDARNLRVTKFSAEGQFLLTFGGEVNKTTKENVCTAADLQAGQQCGAGVAGSAPGFFSYEPIRPTIAVGPDGRIYVGDTDRVQAFEPDGDFAAEIPFTGGLAELAGGRIEGLAVDPVSGDLYLSHDGDDVGKGVYGRVYRISPGGELRGTVQQQIDFEGKTKTVPVNPAGLAVDADGNLFVVDHEGSNALEGPFELLKFDPAGECLICGARFAQPSAATGIGPNLNSVATSNACGLEEAGVYVSVFHGFAPFISALQAYGPAPEDVVACPPPQRPPGIEDQYATAAGTDSAAVQGRINPRFWKDTTYYVQFGDEACLNSGWSEGCQATAPVTLTDKVAGNPLATEPVELTGLDPGTTYHYRFVAQSSGGGPAYGGAASFRTLPLPLAAASGCLNQSFRIGHAARLPDCRAYEMVSPVDKSGGDILTQRSIRDYLVELNVSSLQGDEVTFSSEAAFANSVSAPYSNQYIAKRDPGLGWLTEAISPPRERLFRPAGKAPPYELDNQYKRFSSDLSQAWLMQEADPPLDECGVPGYINWYKRDNATGAYEAVTAKAPPAGKDPLSYFSEVQGASADGNHTVYRANAKLPVDSGTAAETSAYQLYEHVAEPDGCGQTRLVSVLPNGTPAQAGASVGTAAAGTSGAPFIEGRENQVQHAVSQDGTRIYWTAGAEGPGLIYVRVDGTQTFAVSKGAARFWAASADGGFAYYTEGTDLYRFAFSSKKSTLIAGGVPGMVAVSEDAMRAYFVSTDALGAGAVAGKPNLYLFSGSSSSFVATLAPEDVDIDIPYRTVQSIPALRPAQVSADGSHLAFSSHAALTGAENRDAGSGLAASEVFLYQAASGQLRCLSCTATGVRPNGRVQNANNGARTATAAKVPTWQNQFHPPRVINADGSRVFFESYSRLVPGDENDAQDVYQWQRAGSEADCVAAGAELYEPAAGGCLSLISSGKGEDDSYFADASADGADVFFKTSVGLLPQDPGSVDLYDARIGGGFPPPPPPPPPPPCPNPQGCPPIPPRPPVTNPSSSSGPGNPSLTKCKRLQRKAQRLAAKARALRKTATRAQGAKAKALRKQVDRYTRKAKRTGARAQSCFTGVKGLG